MRSLLGKKWNEALWSNFVCARAWISKHGRPMRVRLFRRLEVWRLLRIPYGKQPLSMLLCFQIFLLPSSSFLFSSSSSFPSSSLLSSFPSFPSLSHIFFYLPASCASEDPHLLYFFMDALLLGRPCAVEDVFLRLQRFFFIPLWLRHADYTFRGRQDLGQPLHADVIQAIRTTLQSWFRRQLAREAPGLSARESHGRFNTFLKRNCGGTRLFDLVLRQGIADFRAIHAQLIMFACQESSRPMPNVLLPHAFAQHLPPLPGETRNQREQWRHYVDTLTDPTEKAAAMQQIGMLTITLTWFTGPRRSSWRDATHALNRRVQLRGAYPDLR